MYISNILIILNIINGYCSSKPSGAMSLSSQRLLSIAYSVSPTLLPPPPPYYSHYTASSLSHATRQALTQVLCACLVY